MTDKLIEPITRDDERDLTCATREPSQITVQEAARVLLGGSESPLLVALDPFNNDADVAQDVLNALRALAEGKTMTDKLIEQTIADKAADRILADAEVIKVAEALADAVSRITSRGVSPATGGRMILEVDIEKAEQTLDDFHRAMQRRTDQGEHR